MACKVLKEKNFRSRIVSPAKESHIIEGEIKGFPHKQKLRVENHWIGLIRNVKGLL